MNFFIISYLRKGRYTEVFSKNHSCYSPQEYGKQQIIAVPLLTERMWFTLVAVLDVAMRSVITPKLSPAYTSRVASYSPLQVAMKTCLLQTRFLW